ncbi:MAG: sugar phosphate nucleotidyltransferase [Nitrospinales bacterium]
MKAMVLAAGLGSRLRPLSYERPKPLFPVMNKPAIEHTLSLLKSAGVTDVVINLHHQGNKIADYLEDGSRYGLNINYSNENTILGSAGGIKAAQKYLDGGPFIVINSDVITDIDLQEVIKFHRGKKSCLTLVLKPKVANGPSDPIAIDDQNKVTDFSPELPENMRKFVFTGIQIMEPEIFDRIPPDIFIGTTDKIFPKMIEDKEPVFAHVHKGYWSDIGNRGDYLKTHLDCLTGKVKSIPAQLSATPIGPNIHHPVLIGDGCTISDKAQIGPNVTLGNGCNVEEHATLKNSVCWEGVIIKNNAIVSESILGDGYIVEAGGNLFQEIIGTDKEKAP